MVKVVFFYLDAVGYKFLRYMPFLKSIGKNGTECKISVEPLHQMEFSIFSSQNQKNINYWTWYYYNPKKSPYAWTKFIPNFLDNRFTKKIINYITVLKEYYWGNTHFVPAGRIPLSLLKNFDLTSKKSFIDQNPIEIPTLFDVLRKSNLSYYGYEWPIYSDEKNTRMKIMEKDDFNFLKEVIKHKEKDFLFVHLTIFDALLHKEGSKSKKIIDYLRILDKGLRETYERLKKGNENLIVFAVSDHGMVDVKEKIDVSEILKKELLFFADSTCLRAWGNKREIQELKKELKNFPGKIYTKENKERCPVNFIREYTGDLLFVADSGYEISPNFFNEKIVKAMHGYDRTKELDAMLISNVKITNKKRMNNIDICPLILKALKIQTPKEWKGCKN